MHYPQISCRLIAILHAKFTLLHNKACIYIYMYHFHTSDQRKSSAYISHITLTQNVNEIYALLPVRISC